MKHTIHITKEDLTHYDYSSTKDCPIARALKREFPGADVKMVGYGFYLDDIYYNFNRISHKLENESDKIMNYTAKPFWFRFTPVER